MRNLLRLEPFEAYQSYIAIKRHFSGDYDYFKYNGKVEDVVDYDINHLKIFSREVLKLINNGDPKWEDMLPKGVSKLIKEQKLFGYK